MQSNRLLCERSKYKGSFLLSLILRLLRFILRTEKHDMKKWESL